MFDDAFFMTLALLPIFVVVVVGFVLVKYSFHGLVHLFGWQLTRRPAPVARRAWQKVAGVVLAKLLAPAEQVPLIASVVVFCGGLYLVLDRMRLWDDGLVDTRATVVGLSTACIPYDWFIVPVGTARDCRASERGSYSEREVVQLVYTTAAGSETRALVTRRFLENEDVAIGASVPISYAATEPTHLDYHLWAKSRISPWLIMLVALVLHAVAMVVRRIRRWLAGRPVEEESGLFEQLKGFVRGFRRRNDGGNGDDFCESRTPALDFGHPEQAAQTGRLGAGRR